MSNPLPETTHASAAIVQALRYREDASFITGEIHVDGEQNAWHWLIAEPARG
jgi:hypothetical protein